MERTTDLEALKNGGWFTWGTVQQIYEIGPYAVVESIDWQMDGKSFKIGKWSDDGPHSFHGYVDGRTMGQSFSSLDSAIVGCIAYKHDGPNTQAGYFFCKMIGIAA